LRYSYRFKDYWEDENILSQLAEAEKEAIQSPKRLTVVKQTPFKKTEPAPVTVVEQTPSEKTEPAPSKKIRFVFPVKKTEPAPVIVVEQTPVMVVEQTPVAVVEQVLSEKVEEKKSKESGKLKKNNTGPPHERKICRFGDKCTKGQKCPFVHAAPANPEHVSVPIVGPVLDSSEVFVKKEYKRLRDEFFANRIQMDRLLAFAEERNLSLW
jgi:hypothetical protein